MPQAIEIPQFKNWMKSAKKGDQIVYFRGDLALEGLPIFAAVVLRYADCRPAVIHLTQRKISWGRYEYMATRSRCEYWEPAPKKLDAAA